MSDSEPRARAQFAQALVFGWLDQADATLDELTQVAQEAEISISAAGLSKRFTEEAAQFLHALLQRLAKRVMAADAVEIPLLRRFAALIVEDSSVVTLPQALVEVWRGYGGSGSASQAAVKLHMRIELLTGSLQGPSLSDARLPDTHSPLRDELGPWESLHLRDLGYYDLGWLKQLVVRPPGQRPKRYFLIRFKGATVLLTRGGHRLNLRGLLPPQVGQVREYGVLVGAQARIPARLILLRVPEEVVKQRRERLEEEAKDRGEPVSEELWYLAQWTMVITNVPRRRLSVPEVLVLMRARWQIELLYKLWKEHGLIDEWRSKKPWRILCEFYAKLMAMLIQHWVLVAGCWHDPHRSLVKASAVVRRHAMRVLAALRQHESLERVMHSICRAMRSGCRLNTRQAQPNTSQLLLDGLDWALLDP